MSLIGDALRKARLEAAEREVERRGVLYSARIADAPGRSNLGLGLVLGAALALLATAAGGATVWWLFVRGAADRPSPSAAAQTGMEARVGSDLGGGGGGVSGSGGVSDSNSDSGSNSGSNSDSNSNRDGGRDGGSSGNGDSRQEPLAAPPAPQIEPTGRTGPETGDPAGPAAAGNEQPRSAPPPSPGPSADGFTGVEDGAEVYILEADLGTVRLGLDFIVFRPEDPFAEINGVEVHLGSTVGGFRVKAIEADRVRLSDGRRDIVLRAP